MYGARRAAACWEKLYSRVLREDLGCEQGVSSPCLFFNPKTRVMGMGSWRRLRSVQSRAGNHGVRTISK
eukprot:830921-Prorocentrum_lima.AAC.1